LTFRDYYVKFRPQFGPPKMLLPGQMSPIVTSPAPRSSAAKQWLE